MWLCDFMINAILYSWHSCNVTYGVMWFAWKWTCHSFCCYSYSHVKHVIILILIRTLSMSFYWFWFACKVCHYTDFYSHVKHATVLIIMTSDLHVKHAHWKLCFVFHITCMGLGYDCTEEDSSNIPANLVAWP